MGKCYGLTVSSVDASKQKKQFRTNAEHRQRWQFGRRALPNSGHPTLRHLASLPL